MKALNLFIFMTITSFIIIGCSDPKVQYHNSLLTIICDFDSIYSGYTTVWCLGENNPDLPVINDFKIKTKNYFNSENITDKPFELFPNVYTTEGKIKWEKWKFDPLPYQLMLGDLRKIQPDISLGEEAIRQHVSLEIAINNWLDEAISLTNSLKEISPDVNYLYEINRYNKTIPYTPIDLNCDQVVMLTGDLVSQNVTDALRSPLIPYRNKCLEI